MQARLNIYAGSGKTGEVLPTTLFCQNFPAGIDRQPMRIGEGDTEAH